MKEGEKKGSNNITTTRSSEIHQNTQFKTKSCIQSFKKVLVNKYYMQKDDVKEAKEGKKKHK